MLSIVPSIHSFDQLCLVIVAFGCVDTFAWPDHVGYQLQGVLVARRTQPSRCLAFIRIAIVTSVIGMMSLL